MAAPSQPQQGTFLQLSKKQDAFDQPNFNPVAFINNLYPDEGSLTDLDRFMDAMRKQIRNVDKDIFQAVRAQGGAHTRARQELEAAQGQIVELCGRVKEIQQKAEESETLVQDICKDIRKLDYAKRHLTSAITALRRLAMLTAAVTDLEAIAGRRDSYKKSADLLEAVQQLMEYFQQYEDVPKVKALATRLAAIEQRLTDSVLDDFKVLMGTADVKVSPDNLDRLAAGCLVVNALGPKVRDQLLDWLCDREMAIYQLFSNAGGAEVAKLDRFERRFHWFRARMEERKAEWAVFPEEWRVPQVLCLTFCKITKAHLKRILSDSEGHSVQSDIGPLLTAVVATNKFEKDMATTFGGGQAEDDAGEVESDAVSASEARKRLEKIRQRMKAEEARRQLDKMGDKARAEQEAVRTTFEGAISDAFEGSLHLYVSEEARELSSFLEGLIREEQGHQWRPQDEEVESRILPSANKMFLKIRQSFMRCVKMISRGATLLQLVDVFKRVLDQYSGLLLQRLPKTVHGQTSVPIPYAGNEWYIKLSDDEIKVICFILHTAEFCRETLDGLAAAVRKDIKPAMADQVDLGEQEGSFQSLAGACMNVLVLGINTKLDASLQEMARVRWDLFDSPGDDSGYVLSIRKVLLESAPQLGTSLDTSTLSFLCDKMARAFLPRFSDTLGRCRKISDKGMLQLSIDCDAVRRALHEFPKAARAAAHAKQPDVHADLLALQGIKDPDMEDAEHNPFASYNAYVEREMGAAINTVKVLQSMVDHLVDTFMLLMPATAQNMATFVRVCEMKGLPRAQQAALMAHYQSKLGQDGEGGAELAGGGLGLGPLGGAMGANLGAFKLNMGIFQGRSLTTTSFSNMGAGGGGRPQSISAAAENMASKTKDTFAKVGNFMGTGFTAGFAKIGNVLTQQGTDGA